MNRKQILVEMFMKQSKERLAEIAADLMLNDEPELETETEIRYVNNGKRISKEEIDTVLRVAGPLGQLHASELETLALELGRKPDSIAAIMRNNYQPPEDVAEPDRPVDVPG